MQVAEVISKNMGKNRDSLPRLTNLHALKAVRLKAGALVLDIKEKVLFLFVEFYCNANDIQMVVCGGYLWAAGIG